MLDCAIIGGGPAGLTAGLYATRGGLGDVVMFEKGLPGGAITQSSEIENYPGVFGEITGMELMESWPKQCMQFGLKHTMAEVALLSKVDDIFTITLQDGTTQEAKSVILCMGSKPRKIGFKGESELYGKGVSSCATCDGFFYKNKEVVVIGGGDTALEEALYLAKICTKVYLVHRRESFRASPNTIARVQNTHNIEVVLNHVPYEVYGGAMGVDGIVVENHLSKEKRDIQVPGVFVFAGNDVNNGILEQEDGSFLCQLNGAGQVVVDLKMQTDVAGLFAAGDLRMDAPKQVVCAAGDGATAALSAISYVDENFKN